MDQKKQNNIKQRLTFSLKNSPVPQYLFVQLFDFLFLPQSQLCVMKDKYCMKNKFCQNRKRTNYNIKNDSKLSYKFVRERSASKCIRSKASLSFTSLIKGPIEPDLCDTVRTFGLVVTSNLATQHLARRTIAFSASLGFSCNISGKSANWFSCEKQT